MAKYSHKPSFSLPLILFYISMANQVINKEELKNLINGIQEKYESRRSSNTLLYPPLVINTFKENFGPLVMSFENELKEYLANPKNALSSPKEGVLVKLFNEPDAVSLRLRTLNACYIYAFGKTRDHYLLDLKSTSPKEYSRFVGTPTIIEQEKTTPVDVPSVPDYNNLEKPKKRLKWPPSLIAGCMIMTLFVASIALYLSKTTNIEIDSESDRRYLPKELIENRYYEASTETIQKQEFLKHLTYLDVRVHEKKLYALAAMIAPNGKDNQIKDPDRTDYNEYNIYVISIDQDKIRVLQYPNPYHVRHGAIDVDDTYIHVFTQTKLKDEYNFIGVIHAIGKVEFKNYHHAQSVFDSDNRGLRPFFKNGKVHHFSAAGYYYCINDSTKRKITDKEFCEINQREISAYSDGILDSMSDYMQTMKSTQSNGKVIFGRMLKYIEKNF